MMMAQMAQTFPAHQGIPQHPGLPPGHPLAPGQHPNAHPGMVPQVHPGVSAPGGPQVTQGGPMMGGMPPGAGTTAPGGPVQAHALSHMNPAQAHLFQQPQFPQNFANNPQLLHQQQQHLFRQRLMMQQQQQQQHQQQPHHGGMPVSLPNGNQGINAAQIATMQANPAMRPVNLQMQLQQMPHGQPQNLQHQQQFLAMQAQNAHQAQVPQPNPAGQPGQHTPQQRAAPQPPSVHEAQSVTPQPQPPPHQGSATPQSQPPPAPTSQPPQQPPAAPQPQPTPNPPPQQLQQPPQMGQQPQPPHQQPPPPESQSQPNQGGQQPNPQQQQPPMSAQEAQLKAQQQQNNAALMMQQQQQRMSPKGQSVLILNTFAEHLGTYSAAKDDQKKPDLLQWQGFVDRFYSPTGVLRQGVYNPQAGSKTFEIGSPALARFYLTLFSSGISSMQMVVEGARERESPNGGHIVEAARSSCIYFFSTGAQVFSNCNIKAFFDANNKIEMLDIVVFNHNEYLPRSQLQALEHAEQKQSPKVAKNPGKRNQQKQPQQPAFTLPESVITENGFPFSVISFLEVAETISQMQMLFQYCQSNPQSSPTDALRNIVNTIQTNPAPNPMQNMQNMQMQGMQPMGMQGMPAMPPGMQMPGGMPGMQGQFNPALQQGQNPRGPNMNVANQFASPAASHLGLPGQQGSPHLSGSAHASPAASQFSGTPHMMPQGQLPPNVAPATSASASPNVSHKRRRASTVKVENEDGSGEVNGTGPQGANKVKPSPRMGKRQKGAAQ